MKMKKERRSEEHHFYSLMELFEFFSNFLSLEEMDTVVRESAQGFVARHFESEERTRLQFVKKCEYAMDMVAQLKEAGDRTGLKEFRSER